MTTHTHLSEHLLLAITQSIDVEEGSAQILGL